MRILHVNKFLYRRGGAEAYMLDLAELQAAQGHEVAFFGMRHPQNPSLPFADAFPSFVELEPPPARIAGRLTAAARMLYSPSSRRATKRRRSSMTVLSLHGIPPPAEKRRKV